MALGDYTKTEFANGTTPAINAANLNNNEDKTAELDSNLLTEQVRIDTLYEQRIAMILIYGL
jgi:hypothetical protein